MSPVCGIFLYIFPPVIATNELNLVFGSAHLNKVHPMNAQIQLAQFLAPIFYQSLLPVIDWADVVVE